MRQNMRRLYLPIVLFDACFFPEIENDENWSRNNQTSVYILLQKKNRLHSGFV